MKLTRRQEAFMRKLLDVYREAREPVHYSVLAERLGVSRFTAYDMLRLLEDKGLVSSDYQRGKAGPGRSEVVFLPTPLAHRMVAELAGGTPHEDWETVKERVLDQMQKNDALDPGLIQEMLARIPPEEQDPLKYCIEVIKIVALRLRSHPGRQVLLDYLPRILPEQNAGSRAELSLLGGFALGLLAEEGDGESAWNLELFEHVKRYQAIVVDMDAELRLRLAGSLRQILSSAKELPTT